MSNTGYFIDTNPVDPVTQEPIVPEGAEDLLSSGGGCCGGSCCGGGE